jgi:hypothetical protein
MNRYIKKILTNPWIIFTIFKGTLLFRMLPDKFFLRIIFKAIMGYWPDFKNPKTFNEKLQWLKIYDRNSNYTNLVDKYEVRNYVAQKIGQEHLIPLLGIWDNAAAIDFDHLPNEFVLKCTHDSGGIVLCTQKESFSKADAISFLSKRLKHNFYYNYREWPYKYVTPRIIAEKLMHDQLSDDLKDYKILCFNGDPKYAFVCTERHSESKLKVTFFDSNWIKLPFSRVYPQSNKQIACPKNWEKMKELAKQLSKGIPFVRVDFYEINNQIYFGELTFYPGSGLEAFTPSEWDLILGQEIIILPHH